MGEGSFVNPDYLCREILNTIRDIDVRIDEARSLCHTQVNKEKRVTLVKRLDKLIHTRFDLLQSLSEVIGTNPKSVFGKLNLSYIDNLKRDIKPERKVVSVKKRYIELTKIEIIGLLTLGLIFGMILAS